MMEQIDDGANMSPRKSEYATGQSSGDQSRERLDIGRTSIILSALVFASAAVAVGADLAGAATIAYIFKPLTMILIIGVAWYSYGMTSTAYRMVIIAGLVFSMLGDILLMVPDDLFLSGVVAFLAAQLLYTAAFITAGGLYKSLVVAIPLAIYSLIVGLILAPDLGEMLIPTVIYVVVILVMTWQAIGQWRQTGESRAMMALIGAVLFVISDTLLAINRFTSPLALASLFVLGTYYPAQWFIAMSAGSKHR